MDNIVTEPEGCPPQSLSQRYLPSDLGGDTGFGSKIQSLCPTMLSTWLTKEAIEELALGMAGVVEGTRESLAGFSTWHEMHEDEAIIVRSGWEAIAYSPRSYSVG